MAREFLGRGWKFPVKVDQDTGNIAMSEHEQDIRESIWIILSTARCERAMRPEFGCGIHDLVFAPMSRATLGLFESSVREALMKWEARAEIVNLDISTRDADNGSLEISLNYRVRETNNEFNLVFPFYLTESG
jgi:phage baseplate assembly protein W